MTKPFRRLVLQWLCTAALALAVPAGFVAAVDPFGYFGVNTVGYYYSSERQFKQTLVRGANYNALLLGDSRMAYTDPSLVNLPQYRFVNGGIGGAAFSEQVDLLFDAKLDQLDLVVMGITPSTLTVGANCGKDPTSDASWWDPILFSASWTQAWYAAAALYAKYQGVAPYYRADGTRVSDDKDEIDAGSPNKTDRYWHLIRSTGEHAQYLYEKDRFGMLIDDSCLALLARVRELGDRMGFRVLVVLLPMNRDYFAGFDWRAWLRAEASRQSLARLRAAAHHVVDFADSEYSDSENFWRHDPDHFRPDVGARLIEEAIRIKKRERPSAGDGVTRH